jgi:tripeptide aminopeptidase
MIDLVSRVVELAIQIQQIPAPSFAEGRRAQFVREHFIEEGLEDVTMDSLGNVRARLPGKSQGVKALIVSAHLDTVFPAGTDLQVRREPGKVIAAGIGDNSLGVAALSGMVWALRERSLELNGDLWLVANVCEEGLGDLRGMIGVVDHFGADALGYLVIEGLALGHVYHRAVGVRRYRIAFRTSGGHSWSDYGQPSAIHELAALITQLTALKLPRTPRTTLNVGTMGGGTGINVLASEATCELDLRSEDAAELARLNQKVEELVQAAPREGVQVEAEAIGHRPAGEISLDHPLVQLALFCLREQSLESILTSGSTDANVPLSRGYPAVVLGVTTGGGAHTPNEYIDIEPIERGIGQLAGFVERAWEGS